MNKVRTQIREKRIRTECKKSNQTSDKNALDLAEKLKEVSLNSNHLEIPPNDLNFERIKKTVSSSDIRAKSTSKVISGTKKQTGHPKSSVKKSKKKDSFIVSDSSPVTDDDGLIFYHRDLVERIKVDVAKTTPRRSIKKKINYEDDGIFTPYIISRRSDTSYSDSSDKENYDSPIHIEKKFSVDKNLSKPKFFSDSDEDCKSNTYDSDTDSFKSAASELPPITKPSSRDHLEKDLSWCFSEKEASCESESDDKKTATDQSTPDNVPRRKSSVSTPITFRLNNIKKHTPTPQRLSTPDEQHESWLFLRSLSNCTGTLQVHPQAEQYKKKFKKLKSQLAEKLFRIFNEDIFDSKLPADLKIEWSNRMRRTAGFCYQRRIKTSIGPNNECLRSARIVLSSKVIETPDRLRDTLIHEMCHAACWIINYKADGHGKIWKSWASKVHRKFPELPPVKTCHDYSIKTKFKYRCVNCGYTIGRHSKSLNVERKRCGYCYGKFELLLHNELKSDSFGNSPKNVKARPLSKFALFVKDNYGKIKSENASLKHGEIMKELSKNFAETKISN